VAALSRWAVHILTPEEKLAALGWRAYLRAARADHTRNLGRPWYVAQDSRENGIAQRWRWQAHRYAEWYVAEVLRIDGCVRAVDWVAMGDVVFVAASVVVGGRSRTIKLPSHLHGGAARDVRPRRGRHRHPSSRPVQR